MPPTTSSSTTTATSSASRSNAPSTNATKLLQMPPRPQRPPLHPRPNRLLRRLCNPRRRLLHPPPSRHPLPTRHPPLPPPPKFQILPIQRSLAFADETTLNQPMWVELSREAAKECSPRRKPWVKCTGGEPRRGEGNGLSLNKFFQRSVNELIRFP